MLSQYHSRLQSLITAVTLLLLSAAMNVSVANLPVAVNGQALPSLAPMLESVTPAVVNISTRAPVRDTSRGSLRLEDFFGIPREQRRSGRPQSLGSGVIVDAEAGLVVTNYHVIENAAEILVTLTDGREISASVEGIDPRADVALLSIEADNLSALAWADSDQLRVGDFCVAIGNPFGLGQTVTSGIVSALGRSGLGIEDLEDFIQTDASINPGNSGGALVNLNGELIGINTAIVGPSGGNVGIGFAIPSNMTRDIVEQLLEYGEVRRGMLGIAAQAMTPELLRSFGIDRNYGVVIVTVEPGSPAESSGIRRGDIIVAVDGKPVKTVESVVNRLGLVRIGEEITLTLLRDNQELDITTTVELFNAVHPLLTGTDFENAQTRSGQPYVVIAAIKPGTKLDRLGLQAGDIVLSVNRQAIRTISDLKREAADSPDEVLLLVQRGRDSQFFEVR